MEILIDYKYFFSLLIRNRILLSEIKNEDKAK